MSVIQQLKDNEKPFGLMSEEMQEKASEIRKWRDFQVYRYSAGGFNTLTGKIDGAFIGDETYRLRSDYTEEPEIEECEIYSGKLGELTFNRGDTFTACPIYCVIRERDFIGFKFEDGSWYDAPIKPVGPDGKLWSGNITVDDILSGRVKILHATHVLFRGQK